jgi:hypothetical protein
MGGLALGIATTIKQTDKQDTTEKITCSPSRQAMFKPHAMSMSVKVIERR